MVGSRAEHPLIDGPTVVPATARAPPPAPAPAPAPAGAGALSFDGVDGIPVNMMPAIIVMPMMNDVLLSPQSSCSLALTPLTSLP